MRLRFLHPKPGAEPAAPRKRPPMPGDDDAVAAARVRARRRLVGAVVLLAVGVIGFPVLFETEPRPLPLDTPIETPAREPAAPLRTGPPPKPAPLPAVPADAGNEIAAAPPPAAPISASVVPAPSPRASAPVVAAAPAALASKPDPEPAAPPKPVAVVAPPAPAPAASAGRYVVQVGAFTDAATLREARARVEKLGLKTYTQVIEAEGKPRTRVRLGPYATRDEADAAASKLKRAGLPAAILTL